MRYLSVCSGIEAATVAWHPMGWAPVAFSEVDAFPSAVLAHHYPTVPNRGDMTKFQEWPDADVDVLVGGTPCQSFSVAGLRKGLADPRGNLALTFLAIADRYRPRWVVWENVPGVLSADSHDGPDPCPPARDLDGDDGPADGEEVVVEDEYDADEVHAFACLLAGFSELGYFGAYGTLDAQYAGLAQRRKRVFAVFHLGDWPRAAAVLFDRTSLSGHPAPRREAGARAASVATCGFDVGGTLGPRVSRLTTDECANGAAIVSTGDISHCLNAGGIKADGFDAGEDGTGRGTPLVPIALFDERQITSPDNRMACRVDAPVPTMHEKPFAVAFQANASASNTMNPSQCAPTLDKGKADGMSALIGSRVRRLTPRECERLQGFPTSREHAIIELCFDHRSGVVSAALSCRRSLNAASPADADESPLHADTAEPLSTTPRASREPHVLARVRMHSVAELQALRSHGRLIWCAGSVGASAASLPPTESESIAAAVVQHLPVVVTAIMAGKAGLPASIRLSMPVRSGGRRAATCGAESGVSASDVENAAPQEKFTTSDLGRLTPLDDSSAATSLCSVLAAISGCIPSETLGATFSAEIVADIPYTLIPYRGKPAADGPRYKALGNSMAVTVMRWIGERIDLVQRLPLDDRRGEA